MYLITYECPRCGGRVSLNEQESAWLDAAPHLLAALKRAEQLAQIASDWDLGTDGKVEIDGEWVPCLRLRDEFHTAIARATDI
jgi:hypothetical protein